MKSSIFRDITLRSSLKLTDVSEEHVAYIFRVEEHAKQETSVKAGCKSSEISVDFQRTTRCYVPEETILHNHYCENLKRYIICSRSTSYEIW
jgi:hypothetical protein